MEEENMRAEEAATMAMEDKDAEGSNKAVADDGSDKEAAEEEQTEVLGMFPVPKIIYSKTIPYIEFPEEGRSATNTEGYAPSSAAMFMSAVGTFLNDFRTVVQSQIGDIRKENAEFRQRLEEQEEREEETAYNVPSLQISMASLIDIVKNGEDEWKKEKAKRKQKEKERRKEEERKAWEAAEEAWREAQMQSCLKWY